MTGTTVTVRMSPAQFEVHKKVIRIAAEVAVAYGHLDAEHFCARMLKCCRDEFLTIPAAQQFLRNLKVMDQDLGYGMGL